MKRFALIFAATILHVSNVAAAECEIGGPASGAVVHVKGQSHSLHQRPDSKAPKILNQKATAILKEPQFHTIDSTTQVKLLCGHNDWTKIQIASPDWLTHVVGWIPTKVLATPSSGPRTISDEDIYWDKQTKPHKEMLVAALR